MATTATTTGRSAPPADDAFELLRRLVPLLLAWSYEGTLRAEEVVRRVAASYGIEAEVAMLADSAVLSAGERTLVFSRTPTVPPLDQVSEAKALLRDIEDGVLSARAATARLDAIQRRPPRCSPAWQVVGIALFATGFGISVHATGRSG